MAQSNKEMRSHLSNIQNSLQKANVWVTSPNLLNSSWVPSATREPWAKHFTSLNWILTYICQPITLILSVCLFRKRDFIFTTAIKDTLTITVAYYKHQFKWLLNEYLKIPFSLHLQHILDLLRVRNDNPPSMLWKSPKKSLPEKNSLPSHLGSLNYSSQRPRGSLR